MNGIINVYKESGYTSFDVVARMRGILGQKKIGHTGTLDPQATGVLPVCLGKATKVCGLLTDKDKVYEAVLLLGVSTDTEDLTGQVLAHREVTRTKDEVEAAVVSFVGEYDQIPPMYSALKVNGQKLCDLARKGVTVQRKPRRVTIYDIRIIDIRLPEVQMQIHCSKGTYIRTLCKDIGDKLGCGGCMKSLVRTRVAAFDIADAHTLKELEENWQEDWLVPVDKIFLHLPGAKIKSEADRLAENGNTIPAELVSSAGGKEALPTDGQEIRLYKEDGRFIGLYIYREDLKDYKPVRLFY